MEKQTQLIKIKEELKEIGDKSLVTFLSNVLERKSEKNTHVIGFVGDDLVGKSTIINSLLGENVLPTTVIPSLAETTIKYGNERGVYDRNGSIIENSDLSQSVEEKDYVSISVNNEFLKKNSLVIREFHYLLNKEKLSNIDTMDDIYNCDAVILVMSAEHLLSEMERAFIDNYRKYVGANHFLLIINRLTYVEETEVEHILDYVKNQISSKFSDVNWMVFEPSEKYEDLIKKYTSVDLESGVMALFNMKQDADDIPVRNTLGYIKEQLEIQRKELENLERKNKEERRKEKEQREKQKELEQASIDGALIEFQQKRNNTIESIDGYIKEQFDGILSEIEKEFLGASNKYSWYENELDALWRRLVASVSEKVDCFTTSEIEKDIDWLNGLLETKIGITPVSITVSESSMKSVDKIVPYGVYKRYAPIGVAGGVAIGYCMFRIVGAAIGLGGGLLAYSYLGMKDSTQTEEIQRQLRSKIKDISSHIRKISEQEIEKIYAKILSEFKNEAIDILDTKYGFDCTENNDYIEQRQRIDNLIKKIEEV